ncbi:O-antigen ligase family protein [Herbiconiux sp. 11R-BC]|uniref:O-antigen ligase family protein n=1 Tax=Herbiconiux sp. 11R-BC TaxID=3111637 RepID=UPI003C0EFBF1
MRVGPSARSETIARVAIWVAVGAVIVFLPEGLFRWFLPKDAMLAVAAVVASASVAKGRLPRWMLVAMGMTVALLAVGVAFSASPWAALWGRWPRYEGIVSLSVYAVAVWSGARLLGPSAGERRLISWWSAVSTAAIALGAVSVLEALGLSPIATNLDRAGALLGNATDQGIVGAALFALLVPPGIAVFGEWLGGRARIRRVLLMGGGLAGGLSAVIVSASRAAFLAAGVAVVVLAALLLVQARARGRASGSTPSSRGSVRAALVAGAMLVVVAGIALAVPLTRDRLLGFSPLSFRTISDRFTIWQEALILVAQRPLVGVGPSGFVDAAPRIHDATWYRVVGSQTVLDSPHNVLLQAALGGGIVLPLVLLAAGSAVLWGGVRRWRGAVAASIRPAAAKGRARPATPPVVVGRANLLAGGIAALAAIAVALLTSFTVPATAVLACLVVGALVAAEPGAPPPRMRRLALTGLLGAWALWLVVSAAAEIPFSQAFVLAQRGSIAGAQAAFETTQNLRPWDADVASIAAQTLSSTAVQGVPGAAPLAEAWARRALAVTPDSLPALRALASSQDAAGDLIGELATLDRVVELSPADPEASALRDEVARDAESTP